MNIYETPNHLIMTAETTPPKFACEDGCKKVWWESDMHISASHLEIPKCPMCNGNLKLATNKDFQRLS